MTAAARKVSVLRRLSPHQHHRVTYVELFFDLVFVFAITQLSHMLLAHFTPLGVLQAGMLMLAVWWVWVFMSWVTNWLDPERTPVRLMLFVMMLAGLLMSTSIPKAFDDRGTTFAIAFVTMQVGRSVFFIFAVPRSEVHHRRNFMRIATWLSVSGVFWIAGGLCDPQTRIGLWLVALAIEYAGPAMRFRTPGLGASALQDWTVEGGHMAERCALFIIIALGESIVVTGATFSEAVWVLPTVVAFVIALLGSIAMWWIYFHLGAEAGSHQISRSSDSGRLARLAYTYLHLPIVAGIVVCAVGDELLLAHPDGHSGAKEQLSMIGGPLLYLCGVILFKRCIRGHLQLSHLVGIALLLILIPFAAQLPPLWLSGTTTAILMLVAGWEAVSLGSSGTVAEQDEAEPHVDASSA